MNLLPNKGKEHKVKGQQYVTFMILTDRTKNAKVIRIPKWIRFPIFLFLVTFVLFSFNVVEHIVDLEKQLAVKELMIQKSTYIIEDKDEMIASLNNTNEQHYEKLQALQLMTYELNMKVLDLQDYKDKLDSKLNNTEITTDERPSGFEKIAKESAMILQENLDNKDLATVAKSNNSSNNFDSQIEVLDSTLEYTLTALKNDSYKYEILEKQLDYMIPFWEAYPSGYPVKNSYITSNYGWRRDPFNYNMDFHKGIDFSARYESVYATGKGTVQRAEYDGGYGYVVEINHGYGLVTRYAHNSKLLVKPGDVVERGEKIAISGSTGRSTGPHVHYEIWRYGQVQDPLKYINEGE